LKDKPCKGSMIQALYWKISTIKFHYLDFF